MSRSRAVPLLLLAALASVPLGASAHAALPCPPGLGVGLADFPSGTKDPRAQTYIVDHVAPGARFSRRFQVCNGTSKPVTVRLYPGPAAIDAGGFRVTEGRVSSELTSWITVDPPTVTVPAGRRVLARASFAIPPNAESGERYGVLLAELPPSSSSGVQVASRVGVRIYLDVGPGGAPRSDFSVDALQAARDKKGDALVTALVHNTGLRALDMTGSMTLRNGPSGLSGGPYRATIGTTLAPGQTEPVLVQVGGGVAAGPWSATLTLRSGLLERRVQAALTFPAGAGVQAAPVRPKDVPLGKNRKVLIPVAATLIGIVLLLLGGLPLAKRRRPSAPQ